METKHELIGKEISKVTFVLGIVAFLILIAGAVGGYVYVAQQQDKKQESAQQQRGEQKQQQNNGSGQKSTPTTPVASYGTATCPTTLTSAEITEIAGWQQKTNNTYNFKYYIPADWTVFTPETSEGVPEEAYYRDTDYNVGFMNLEYLVDWKANAIYHAYQQVGVTNLQVACANATLTTRRVTEQPNLNLLEANFTLNGKKHQIFYFYKSLGGASLDSDFGEQFRLLLKTIQLNS